MATNANESVPTSAEVSESLASHNSASAASVSLTMLSNATENASLQPDTAAESKEPRQFWAIRRCEGLNAPAIFSDWGDCAVYVNPRENDGAVVEFKSFPTIIEAVSYAFGTSAITEQQDSQSLPGPMMTESCMSGDPACPKETSGVATSSGTSISTSGAHTKDDSHQNERSTSWNSEGPLSTEDPEASETQTTQSVPAVTPTEMDMDKGTEDGPRMGGRNYRRSVNTTYSSGEDEPVEESTGKEPVEPSEDDVLCGRGVSGYHRSARGRGIHMT